MPTGLIQIIILFDKALKYGNDVKFLRFVGTNAELL
jgi:hypothetical protein